MGRSTGGETTAAGCAAGVAGAIGAGGNSATGVSGAARGSPLSAAVVTRSMWRGARYGPPGGAEELGTELPAPRAKSPRTATKATVLARALSRDAPRLAPNPPHAAIGGCSTKGERHAVALSCAGEVSIAVVLASQQPASWVLYATARQWARMRLRCLRRS